MFDRVQTYSWDRLLFKKLGLDTFDIETHKEQHVGKVDFENGSWVKIWVEAKPAEFWRFEVYVAESKRKYSISTGSGSLGNYWGTVEKVAESLIVIDTIEQL